MSLMSKLLTILTIGSLTLFAGKDVNDEVTSFVKRSIAVSQQYKVKNVRVVSKNELEDLEGWSVYFFKIDLELVKQKGKIITITDSIFSNGKYISKDFTIIQGGGSLKKTVSPEVDPKLYNKEHLIYGNYEAKHKILVFSDPQCHFCLDIVPDVMDFVEKHDKDFALFYYHLPLEKLHPAAATIVKATLAAEKKGYMNILKRVYLEDIDIRTKDQQKILDLFNKKLKTDITIEDIKKEDIKKRYIEDIEAARGLMVSGTPTVFVNGKKDPTRMSYTKLLKEKK